MRELNNRKKENRSFTFIQKNYYYNYNFLSQIFNLKNYISFHQIFNIKNRISLHQIQKQSKFLTILTISVTIFTLFVGNISFDDISLFSTDKQIEYQMIPVWVEKSGPFVTEEFEGGGGSITWNLGTTRLMELPSQDGVNVIIPEGLESSSITVIKGPYIEFDQKDYLTTEIVRPVIYDFWRNEDPKHAEQLGSFNGHDIIISTKSGNELDYIFTETGKDTGIFTAEIKLTGIKDFDINNDGKIDSSGITFGQGPDNGMISTSNDDELTVSYQVTPGNYVTNTVPIKMREGEISIHQNPNNPDSFFVNLEDWDINLDYSEKEQVKLKIISDSDLDGIQVVIDEHDFPGIFWGEIIISDYKDSLTVFPGDEISVIYVDKTLPRPYEIGEVKEITASIVYKPNENIVNR